MHTVLKITIAQILTCTAPLSKECDATTQVEQKMWQYRLNKFGPTTLKHDLLIRPLLHHNHSPSLDENTTIGGLQVLPRSEKRPTVATQDQQLEHMETGETGSGFIDADEVLFNILLLVRNVEQQRSFGKNCFHFLLQ